MQSKKSIPVKFNIFDLEFQPYKEKSQEIGSFKIIKACIDRINKERRENKRYIIIDRHEKRDKAEPRKLFISSAAFSIPDKMFKCKIHLIRDKMPSFLNRETLSFESIDVLKDKDVVETTNFYIDMDRPNDPTIIVEYSSLGPKISDIEYYFRYISSSKMLYLSTKCKAKVHMDRDVEQVLDTLKNVFRFKFKARPENLPAMYHNTKDKFFTELQALGNLTNPKTIRVDLGFRNSFGKQVVSEDNYKMLNTTKKILNAVSGDIAILEKMDEFYLEYEDSNGDAQDYNFVRGKKTLEFNCPLKDEKKGQIDTKILFELANQHYSEYKLSRT